MSDTQKKTTDGDKRDTTKKLLVGGGIVGAAAITHRQWVKPVVEVAVLPAHAGTSDEPPTETYPD